MLGPPEPQAGMQAEGELGLHVNEFFLDQLIGGERAAQLPAPEGIVARREPDCTLIAERYRLSTRSTSRAISP